MCRYLFQLPPWTTWMSPTSELSPQLLTYRRPSVTLPIDVRKNIDNLFWEKVSDLAIGNETEIDSCHLQHYYWLDSFVIRAIELSQIEKQKERNAIAGNRTRAWSVAGTYLTTWLLLLLFSSPLLPIHLLLSISHTSMNSANPKQLSIVNLLLSLGILILGTFESQSLWIVVFVTLLSGIRILFKSEWMLFSQL